MANDTPICEYAAKGQSPELVCEVCGFYPLEPVHGHFACPSCRHITTCCEGLPLSKGVE